MDFYFKSLKYFIVKNKLKEMNSFRIEEINNKINVYVFFVAAGTNMGDHAIVEAEIRYLNKIFNNNVNIHEVSVSQTESAVDFLKKNVKGTDIIVLSGGGYIGDEYVEVYYPLKKILKNFSNNKIFCMPQTIFFKNKIREKNFINLCKKCSNLQIFTREKKSYNIFNRHGVKNTIVPDIVLSNKVQKHISEGDILLCMRNDVERKITDDDISYIKQLLSGKKVREIDTVVENIFDISNRKQELEKLMNEFSTSSLVITDRIHGMIFSYLTETPCIALSNYNHKVKSEYEWLKDCNYIYFIDDTHDEFNNKLNLIKNINEKETVNLENEFSPLSKGLIDIYEERI